jgi:hypothetical protein
MRKVSQFTLMICNMHAKWAEFIKHELFNHQLKMILDGTVSTEISSSKINIEINKFKI